MSTLGVAPQTVVDCRIGLPDRWRSWTPGSAAEQLRSVVDPLVDDDVARSSLEAAVLWCDEHYAQDGLFLLAVWVPDARSGLVAGALVAVCSAVPPGPDPVADLFKHASRPPRARDRKVLHYDKARGAVGAGPLVLELLTLATKSTRQVVAQAIWTIVPPGSDSAVVLNVSTSDLGLSATLVEQSEIIAQSVEVDLGPAQLAPAQ